MKKWVRYITITIALFVSLIIFFRVKTFLEGEEGRIKRIIYAAKKATEQEDIFKCISFISHSYADKYGNDRRILLLVAQKAFDTYDNIVIGVRKLNISLDKDTAKAEVEATGVARNVETKESKVLEIETIEFLIFFQKEEAGWKVIRLEFLEPQDIPLPGIT